MAGICFTWIKGSGTSDVMRIVNGRVERVSRSKLVDERDRQDREDQREVTKEFERWLKDVHFKGSGKGNTH